MLTHFSTDNCTLFEPLMNEACCYGAVVVSSCHLPQAWTRDRKATGNNKAPSVDDSNTNTYMCIYIYIYVYVYIYMHRERERYMYICIHILICISFIIIIIISSSSSMSRLSAAGWLKL